MRRFSVNKPQFVSLIKMSRRCNCMRFWHPVIDVGVNKWKSAGTSCLPQTKWPLEAFLLWWLMDDDNLLISVFMWPSEMTQAVIFFWLQNQYLLVPNLFSGFYVFFLSVKVFVFFLLQVIINVKFKINERVRALHFWRLKNARNQLVWNSGQTYWWQSFDLFLLKIASRVQRDVPLAATEKSQEHFLPYLLRVCSHL